LDDMDAPEASLHDDANGLDADVSVDASTEASPEEVVMQSERAAASTATASLETLRRTGRPFHGTNAAWMNALLSDRLGALSVDEGWKVLEMQLEDGQGTMTVRARRDEDNVSIAVTFSDPQMRALAAENVDRLRETLRHQYEASVDLSLMSDGAGEAPHERNHESRGRAASPIRDLRAETVSMAVRASATRAALAGARNEWIG